MIEQAINYYNQVEALAKQQVPIDFRAVAAQMVVILQQVPMPVQTPEQDV